MAEIILTGDALEQLRHLPPESVFAAAWGILC